MSMPINGGNIVSSGQHGAGTITYGPTGSGSTVNDDTRIAAVSIQAAAGGNARGRIAFGFDAAPGALASFATTPDSSGLAYNAGPNGGGSVTISCDYPSGAAYVSIENEANVIVTFWSKQ